MKQAMLRLIFMISPVVAMKMDTSRMDGRDAPFDVLEGANASDNGSEVLENIVLRNALHDLREAEEVPAPEDISANSSANASSAWGGNATNSTDQGMGKLAENLEFLFIKVAQLETVVELQQLEIKSLIEWKQSHLEAEHDQETPRMSLMELQHKEQQSTENAQTIFKKVLEKHHHQREKKQFVTPVKTMEGQQSQEHRGHRANHAANSKSKQPKDPNSQQGSLLQRQRRASESDEKELEDTVSSKVIGTIVDGAKKVGGAIKDGTGLVGDALGDAYASATDKIAFVANTAIDTVEKAIDILKRGFNSWHAGCSVIAPYLSFSQLGAHIFFGASHCQITLMGQTTKLFHFHWHQQNIVFPQPLLTAAHFATSQVEVAMHWGAQLGSQCSIHGGGLIPCLASKLVGSLVSSGIGGKILDAAPPLKAVATMGGELTSCAQTGPGLVACLGGKLVSSGIGGTLVSSGIGGQILDAIPPLKMMKNMGDLYGGCHNHGGHGLLTCFAGGLVGPLVSRGIATHILDSAPPLKSVFNMGHELVNCDQSAQGLVACLGNRIINYVPPLSHLNKMSEILADFLEGFARVATTIAGQVLKGGSSLIQEAANSQFPATGAPPMVHHSGQSLVIKTHTQEHKPKMSALQTQEERGEDAGPVKGGFGFPKFHSESGNYQSKLVSQWHGYETDTSSCLAFAPKNKHGHAGQATAADWQVQNENDFVALEPWAVPCGNKWMKDNWDKWQGYSFYTGELSIEKCVTVTFSLSMQPVVAFVGGVQFDLMPKPLVEVGTTVCWPRGRPDGQDLSLLRMEIRTSGILLFRRSLRLSKRYAEPTDFVDHAGHLMKSTASWNQPANPRRAMSRTKLLQTNAETNAETLEANNESHADEGESRESRESLEWMDEDLYLASANYSQELGVNLTSETHGKDAERRLSLAEAMAQGAFELFNFEHPGMVNFKLKALLQGNEFQMRAAMGFGPFGSGERTFKLVNIVDQFAVVLYALPFVSASTRDKALASLRNFAGEDLPPPPVTLKPGMTIALHNRFFNQYLNLHSGHGKGPGVVGSTHTRSFEAGLPSNWEFERWLVVDAGGGEIALHNQRWNRFLTINHMLWGHPATAREFHTSWGHQKFTVGHSQGFIGLHNKLTGKWVSVGPHHSSYASPPHATLPAGWTQQQFRVQVLQPYLKPGSTVGLFSRIHNRVLRMHNNFMDGAHPGAGPQIILNPAHTWERFEVVDVGNGEIALFNHKWVRFVGLVGGKVISTEHKHIHQLPADWTWARFAIVPGGHGQIGLYSADSKCFVQMTPHAAMQCSGTIDAQDFPDGWTWERWEVVEVSSPDSGAPKPTVPGGWKFGLR